MLWLKRMRDVYYWFSGEGGGETIMELNTDSVFIFTLGIMKVSWGVFYRPDPQSSYRHFFLHSFVAMKVLNGNYDMLFQLI